MPYRPHRAQPGRPARLCSSCRFAAPLLLLVAAALVLGAVQPRAVQAAPRHGQALGAEPKYPAGFAHYDYANPQAPKGGTLVLAGVGNFDTLNPFSLKGRQNYMLGRLGQGLVFESLMAGSDDEAFSQYGLLAESVDVSADGLSVTYVLNAKARFSDGKPVTAADVKFSFDLLRSEVATPLYRYYYLDVTAAEVLDTRRVRFRFAQPNRELAMILGQHPVLPRHVYAKGDFGRDFTERAVGSGPYTVGRLDLGHRIEFLRQRDYWGRDLNVNVGKYNFDTIVVKYYGDATVSLEAFKAGEFDFLPVNSSKQWAVDVQGDKWERGLIVKENLPHSNAAGMQGYVFNLRRPLFKQRAVRRALAMAMDFEWSNRNLFHGQYTALDSYFDNSELAAEGLPSAAELKLLEPLRGHLPPEVFTEPMGPGSEQLPLRDSMRLAKRLLNQAGWKVQAGVLTETATGTPMRFRITLASPEFERITEPFINNLRKLGVEATMKVVDSSVYEQAVRRFDFDMVVDNFAQSLSPGNEQRDFWHSDAAGQEGSRNSIGLADPAVDALVEAVIKARSRADLVTATRALDRALWHGHYVVPNWYIASHRVTYWNKFSRPAKLPTYFAPLSAAYFWWEDPAKAAALASQR